MFRKKDGVFVDVCIFEYVKYNALLVANSGVTNCPDFHFHCSFTLGFRKIAARMSPIPTRRTAPPTTKATPVGVEVAVSILGVSPASTPPRVRQTPRMVSIGPIASRCACTMARAFSASWYLARNWERSATSSRSLLLSSSSRTPTAAADNSLSVKERRRRSVGRLTFSTEGSTVAVESSSSSSLITDHTPNALADSVRWEAG